MRWNQLDLEIRKIRVSDMTKSKKTLEVPINDAAKSAFDTLRKLAQKDNDFVFAAGKSHLTDVKNPFKTALKRARARLIEAGKPEAAGGLKGFRFHDLRHTAASWHAMGGAGLPAIQKFLGHASIKMTLRYAHLSPDFLGHEAKILDKMLTPLPTHAQTAADRSEPDRDSGVPAKSAGHLIGSL